VATVEHISEPFPWRAATLVAAGVAALELVALVAIGALLIAHPFSKSKHPAAVAATAAVVHHAKPAHARRVVPIPAKDRFGPIPAHALRPASQVRVLVLNANGMAGAAHTEAARLSALGYPIGGAANAPSHHYARSMVMYIPGYVKEARRLAHQTHIGMVAPVDGLTTSALSRSKLVVLLGS
jgi:LytR cell envelope-related transcriptional attenuator